MKLQATTFLKPLSIILAVTFCAVGATVAQIAVRAKPAKSSFIAHEPINLKVTITNHAGQTLAFKNNSRRGWIEFIVEKRGGDTLHASRLVSYKPIAIAAGKAMTTSFTLNTSYDLTLPGNYSAYAVVRLPGQDMTQGIRSNKVHFTVNKGYATFRQRAGVPGTRGGTIEYRIMNVADDQRNDLYVQVEDIKRGRVIATYSMGRSLTFRKYKATLDSKNNLHVLFLTSPSLHCHTVVNYAGKTILREYHRKAGGGSPRLVTTTSGQVGVANSVLYDPVKERERKRQIHKLSELPNGL